LPAPTARKSLWARQIYASTCKKQVTQGQGSKRRTAVCRHQIHTTLCQTEGIVHLFLTAHQPGDRASTRRRNVANQQTGRSSPGRPRAPGSQLAACELMRFRCCAWVREARACPGLSKQVSRLIQGASRWSLGQPGGRHSSRGLAPLPSEHRPHEPGAALG